MAVVGALDMFTGIIEEVGEVVEARVGLLRVRVNRSSRASLGSMPP